MLKVKLKPLTILCVCKTDNDQVLQHLVGDLQNAVAKQRYKQNRAEHLYHNRFTDLPCHIIRNKTKM